MLVSTVLTTLTAAFLAPAVSAQGRRHFKLKDTDLCLDLKDGKAQLGQPVQLWKCHDGKEQIWNLEVPQRVLDDDELLGELLFSRIRWGGSTMDNNLCLGFRTKRNEPLAQIDPNELWITEVILVDCLRNYVGWNIDRLGKYCAYRKHRKDAYCMQIDGNKPNNGTKILVVTPSKATMAARWVER